MHAEGHRRSLTNGQDKSRNTTNEGDLAQIALGVTARVPFGGPSQPKQDGQTLEFSSPAYGFAASNRICFSGSV